MSMSPSFRIPSEAWGALSRLPMVMLSLMLLKIAVASASGDFDRVDMNKDGLIDQEEFKVIAPAVEAFFESISAKVAPALEDAGFMSAFVNSVIVILITEIGDKTFFIAAVLAMRNGRLVVYLGCMSALALMHVLSCIMGYALPSLLPRTYTHYASAFLFIYFGFKLLKDAREMGEGPSEELLEVEEELISKKEGAAQEQERDLEDGGDGKSKPRPGGILGELYAEGAVFTQALTLTFLAEWGDRSQIVTIALASSKDPYGIIAGGLLGHAFCTGVAVIGGRLLASRISERTVAIVGGVLFLAFAVHSFVMGPDAL